MYETKIDFERIPGLEHIVRIPVEDYADPKVFEQVLEATLDSCLKSGDYRVVVDL